MKYNTKEIPNNLPSSVKYFRQAVQHMADQIAAAEDEEMISRLTKMADCATFERAEIEDDGET